MRRKRNLLIIGLVSTGIMMYYLQINLVNVYFAIGTNVPDLLLIVTVFIGVRLGQIPGSLFGFVFGLFQDALINFYGLNALCKTTAGYAARYFQTDRVMLAEKFYFPVVVFFSAILHSTIFYAIQTLDGEVGFWNLMAHDGFWNALYSAVTAFMLWLSLPPKWIAYIRFDALYDF